VNNNWTKVTELVLNGYYQQIPDIEKVLGEDITDEIGQALDKFTYMQV
jgi:hypothetical protein